MKNVRNIFVLYLVGLLLLSGCGKETTTETAAAVNTAPAETIPETTADPLPTDLDFGGETVSMYVRGDTLDTEFAAEATGDVVDDALYQRNFNIEERYNAKLSIFANTSADYWGERNIYMDTVRSSVMANDGSIDIVAGLSNIMPTMAKEGLFTNLTAADMPYLHFSADWWSKTLVDELAIDGRLYFASGEAGLGVIRGLMCICQRFGHRFRLEEAATARLLESYSCLPPLPELPPEQLVSGMGFIVKAICNAWKRIRNTSNVAQLPPLPILSESTGNATINRAIDFMLSYYTERLTVADIAAAAGCSSSYITHRFHKYTGMSIVRYLNLLRVRRAVLSMANKDISLTEIALQCGFSSAAYFSRVFTELMGKSPIEVQQML